MLYLIRLDVRQPDDMSLSEFREIWYRDAVATQETHTSGIVQSFKVVGRWTVFAIAEFPDNEALDEALERLPIIEDLGNAVEIEVIPVRPYDKLDVPRRAPTEPTEEPSQPSQITQDIRDLDVPGRMPSESEQVAATESEQLEVGQEQPEGVAGQITDAIRGLDAIPQREPVELEEPAAVAEPEAQSEVGQITDAIRGLDTTEPEQSEVGQITDDIRNLDAASRQEPVEPEEQATAGESEDSITGMIQSLDAPTKPEEAKPYEQAKMGHGTASADTPHENLKAVEPEATPGPRILLRFVGGPANGETLEVGREGATVGRSPENSIRIVDERLSRRHLQIEFEDGEYWLTDLGSSNGTFINETRLDEPHQLQSGDVIRLGSTRLNVTLNAEPAR